MALHKDEAIVLFKRAYGESDKIIRLFTLTSGKVAAIAKGASKSRKRFMNTLEPFNHIRVEYFEKYGRGMVRLENADLLEANSGIEISLRRACSAAFFTEFVDRLTKERERHDELFFALKDNLRDIRQRDLSYADILRRQLMMLQMLGFMPNFHTCVYCGKEIPDGHKILFSKERGGILCAVCSRSIPHKRYGEGIIPRLAAMSSFRRDGSWETRVPSILVKEPESGFLGPRDGEGSGTFESEAQDIMEGFMSFHLDVEFKSYRILKGIMR
jgi:DNA repair protein RecO (recombination protein O)